MVEQRKPNETDVVCGLDVGTGGARVYALDPSGQVVAHVERKFTRPAYQPQPGYAEQDALAWWETSRDCLRELTRIIHPERIRALSIDSTSGTFVPVDSSGQPLIPALMYNDGRAQGLDAEVNEAAAEFIEHFGYSFPPAFALVKMLWLYRNRPDIIAKTAKFLHAADFLVGKLTGHYDRTDTSNALKSGANPLTNEWPRFIEDRLGIALDKLPQVYRPGELIGEVSREAAAETGLVPGTAVIAGVTDGTASFLASGAKAVGDWNLTIGTTIVIRGVADTLICDPQGRYYCHRHPEGFWLPGGASNVGGEALAKTFSAEAISALDQAARSLIPTSLLVYPLVRKGERMPFVSPDAEGFVIGEPESEAAKFAAYVEGIALVTAWSVEAAAELGAPTGGEYFLTGGGSHGTTLSVALASVLERPLIVVKAPEGAFGSALLAAAWAWYDGAVSKAQAALVERAEIIEPEMALARPLQSKLGELKEVCWKRGYHS